ncbi:MAG: hypothetical protein JXR48_13285 [Candidatus Delongbacteria bacterium]|nr:hypothetical protein [Candidatus Delongbacteria bacterium]MBN2835928.1 hypothetical protein [Candidatus Delongbacteria bacterium]
MKYFVYLLLLSLLLVSCISSETVVKEDTSNEIIDQNGFKYSKDKFESLVAFKVIKRNGVLLFSENSLTSQFITKLDFKTFVEISDIDDQDQLIKVRVFDKERGYIEGYIKSALLFPSVYWGEKLKLSDSEIERIKEREREKELRLLEKENKRIAKEKEEKEKKVIAEVGTDVKNVIGMNYTQISSYLRKDYKEDLKYAENATKTLKFNSKSNSIYFEMYDSKITGFTLIDNNIGFDDFEVDKFLYKMIGEIFYDLEEEYKINDSITKLFCKTDKRQYVLVIKKDKSKPKQNIEITIGAFSGIEG